MDALTYFWILLKASFFSTTGLGNVPILHDDLLARGWATDKQFAEALAVGQISPGPSGLWVISLGYLMGGLRGSGLALLAICVPPLLALLVEQFHRRVGDHPLVRGFVWGLSLAVVSIFPVVMVNLLRSIGVDRISLLIVLVSLGLGLTRRVPLIVLLVLAALVGMVLY